MNDPDVKRHLDVINTTKQFINNIVISNDLIVMDRSVSALKNYYDGLSSPDDEQRCRFNEVDIFLKEHGVPPEQILPLLKCFEKVANPPRKRGRPGKRSNVIGPVSARLHKEDEPLLGSRPVTVSFELVL